MGDNLQKQLMYSELCAAIQGSPLIIKYLKLKFAVKGQEEHSAVDVKLRLTKPKYQSNWDVGCFFSALRLFSKMDSGLQKVTKVQTINKTP